GQVWGRNGADFYLLDQVRGRYDFDETVKAIWDTSTRWPESTSKLVEAQGLGAAIVTHLKAKLPGLIPISVKGSKETRAFNCVAVWQSKNVYIPKPGDGKYAWVDEYLQEFLNFPNVAYDDQVDATTLALNQLHGSLFRKPKECTAKARDAPPLYSPPLPRHHYFIGWVPGRSLDMYTVLVFDRTENTVVHFGRFTVESLEPQIAGLSQLSRYYNRAVVRAFDRVNGALTSELEMRGVWVERVKFSKLEDCYENLAILKESDMITIPAYPKLQAEIDVFKSDFTFDGKAGYSLQGRPAIRSPSLVSRDVRPQRGTDERPQEAERLL
ncbi:MAG: phage terminase large subunit, partial [Halobacteriota archaeon]